MTIYSFPTSAPTVVSAAPLIDQQSWVIPGRTANTVVNLNPASSSFIGGIANGADNQILTLRNNSTTGLIWLTHEDTSSSSNDRLSMPKESMYLFPGHMAQFRYSGLTLRWELLAITEDVVDNYVVGSAILPGTGAVVVSTGLGTTAVTGVLTTAAASVTPVLSFDARPKIQLTSAVANGGIDSRRATLDYMRGIITTTQGIFYLSRFRVQSVGATGAAGVIMSPSNTALTLPPRLSNNTTGVVVQGGETTLRSFTRGNTATTEIDLGVNFPFTGTYDAVVWAPPGASFQHIMVRRLDAEFKAMNIFNVNMIPGNVPLGYRSLVTVGATATTNSMQTAFMYCRNIK